MCPNPNESILVAISMLSLLGCSYIIGSYVYIPATRQHPAGIMLGMSVYAALTQILFLTDHFTNGQVCEKAAPVVEFSLTGQESYLLMFAFDLVLALKNPFADEKERMIQYHVIAAISSFTFAFIASADHMDAMFGFCWMKEQTPVAPVDKDYGTFFAVQVLFIYIFSLAAIVRSWKTLQKGLPNTFTTRKRILRHLKYYVGFFFAHWTVALTLYFSYLYLFPKETGLKCGVWSMFSGVVVAKGLVNLVIWIRTSNIYNVMEQLMTLGYVDMPRHGSDSINWALRLEILTNTTKGICDSIDRAERQVAACTILDRQYQFTQIEEIVIKNKSMNGSDEEVLFYDYAPHMFRHLRKLSRINPEDYRRSLEQTTKERVSEGKSGAFFFFTEDQKYVVKTLTREELKFLLSILPKYCKYMKRNPESLITRFVGCHAIRMYNKMMHFVVMQSVFDTSLQIHERFDLKGSWVGRLEGRKPTGSVATCKYCRQEFVVGGSNGQRCESRQGGRRHMYDQVGKDLNWNRQMCLPRVTASHLAKQLMLDSTFLQRINSIDYSLLVGLHHRSFNVENSSETLFDLSSYDMDAPFYRATMGGMSVDVVHGPGIYFMGLIDILQHWNWRKRLERFVRVYIMLQDRHGISVTSPKAYAERFQQRVVQELIYDGNDDIDSDILSNDSMVSSFVSLREFESPSFTPNPYKELNTAKNSPEVRRRDSQNDTIMEEGYNIVNSPVMDRSVSRSA